MPSVVAPNTDETVNAATAAGENLAAKGTAVVSKTADAASNIASNTAAAAAEYIPPFRFKITIE